MTTTTSPALNPKQVHYLKRELITLELEKELNLLGENATLRTLFPTDNPADGITAGLATVPTSMVALRADTPLLRHAFNQYVLTFPLLQDTDRVEFWGKVQRFLDEFRKLQITNSAERTELTRRKKIGQKIERLLVLLYGVGIKVKEGKEESIRVEEELQKVKNKELVAKIVKIEGEESIVKWMTMNGLDINVVTVRDVTEKKHMMEVAHAEFVIETRIDEKEAVYVARRHGQFRNLYNDLKHLHPTIEVPQVPPKAQNIFNRRPTEHHLYRERDRLSLRSFLHRVVADPRLARSEIFIQFLTSDPFKMNHEESYNAERRAEMDQIRADQEKRFKEEVDRKVEKLNGQLEGLKKELMKPGGLTTLFNTIKTTPDVDSLPMSLRTAFEWGRINFAFVLHTHFLTSDDAAQNLATLKRTHSLIPYRTLRTALHLSNPVGMIKGVLDIFLAQPFGTNSLFQRILMANLNEEAKGYQQDIEDLEKSIGDGALCYKVRNAVYHFKGVVADPALSPPEQVKALLRNEHILPPLTPDQILRVAAADQEGAAGKEARVLVRKLRQLWIVQMRKRDQEMLMELVTQGIAGDLLKDIFAIFYKPLAQVYKAANIGDTLMDVSSFIDDLIELVEGVHLEDMSNTIQPFIEMVRRHEPRFYAFVHSVHKNDATGIFDGLLAYIDRILNGMNQGILSSHLDLGKIVTSQLSVAEYPALVAEIDVLCDHHLARKARHLEQVRQRAEAAAREGREEVEMEAVVSGLVRSEELEGVMNEMQELDFSSDDEEDEEAEWDELEMEEEVERVANGVKSGRWWKKQQWPKGEGDEPAPPPKLVVIPKLVPGFLEAIVRGLAV